MAGGNPNDVEVKEFDHDHDTDVNLHKPQESIEAFTEMISEGVEGGENKDH